jgi:hypothetical protein
MAKTSERASLVTSPHRRGSASPERNTSIHQAFQESKMQLGMIGLGRMGDNIARGRMKHARLADRIPRVPRTAAIYPRFRSRKEHTFSEKILSAMRAGFGGHSEPQQQSAAGTAKSKAGRA